MDSSTEMNNPRSKHYIPSFIKYLSDHTASKLELPPAVVKKVLLRGGFAANLVQLNIRSGNKWMVEIENDGDKYYFSRGWLDFINDTKTEIGDMFLFVPSNNSIFNVSIFGSNRVQKDLSYAIPTTYTGGNESEKSDITTEEANEDGDDEPSSNPTSKIW